MNICVFCGSAEGHNSIYATAAKELAEIFSKQNHTLVYGGGKVGLMGILADSVLQNKGNAIGVIPNFLLQLEVGHKDLTRLEVVETMHERKKRMADLSDAFIAIPGGWGTLDELAEILTWRQLGLINQPIGILNVNHFFDPLLQQMEHMVKEGFLKKDSLDLLKVSASPSILIDLLSL